MFGIIMCANLKRFPEPPKGYSESKVINCPHCRAEVWISQKKQNLMQNLHRYELYCYDCLETKAISNPKFITEALRLDI